MTGILSCSNQEDMDQNLEKFDAIRFADTVFQFGIATTIKEDNTSPSGNLSLGLGSELINHKLRLYTYNDQIEPEILTCLGLLGKYP